MPRSFAALRPYFYFAVLAWINVYICREAFRVEGIGHFNSMHGEWMAMARLGDFRWWHASWWPWWGAGSPLENAYTPLVPMLTAFMAWVTHSPIALAFNRLSGIVYCATPLVMYVVGWRISGSAGYSFAAGVACSLMSPIRWIVPDDYFRWRGLREARQLMMLFEWDDLPHILSITLLPLAAWFLWRGLKSKRGSDFTIAGAAMACMMLSNMFGAVLVALTVLTLPLAIDSGQQRFSAFARGIVTAGCAWIVVSPWLSPSLLRNIRADSILSGETPSVWMALKALVPVVAVMAALLWLMHRRVVHWGFRWLLLFGSIMVLIPVLDQYAGVRFLPQPGRYKVEANLALIWMAVFLLRPLVDRIPWRIRAVVVVLLVCAAALQVVYFRRYAKPVLRPVETAQTIEYQTSKWVEKNLPGQRIMMPGSIGPWADLFADVTQLGGQQYSTAPNQSQMIASYTILTGVPDVQKDADASVLWLKAYGAQAVVVPGPQSPEAWHPVINPRKFNGVLPALWRERDTTVYQVLPGPWSLAHVVRPEDVVRHAPIHGLDVGELRRYVTALEDPSAAPAKLRWEGNNMVIIDAQLRPGDVVSVQITWDPGWHARVNRTERAIRRDGIGLMTVDAHCVGDCGIELDYDGGAERRACRIASAGLPVLLLIVFVRRKRAGGSQRRR